MEGIRSLPWDHSKNINSFQTDSIAPIRMHKIKGRTTRTSTVGSPRVRVWVSQSTSKEPHALIPHVSSVLYVLFFDFGRGCLWNITECSHKRPFFAIYGCFNATYSQVKGYLQPHICTHSRAYAKSWKYDLSYNPALIVFYVFCANRMQNVRKFWIRSTLSGYVCDTPVYENLRGASCVVSTADLRSWNKKKKHLSLCACQHYYVFQTVM